MDGSSHFIYEVYYNDSAPYSPALQTDKPDCAAPVPMTELSDLAVADALSIFKQITGSDELFKPEQAASQADDDD